MEVIAKQLLKRGARLEMVGDAPAVVTVALNFPVETATLDD